MSAIAVQGAAGRVGTAIMNVLVSRGHSIAAAFEHKNSPQIGKRIDAFLQGAGRQQEINTVFEVLSPERLAACDGVIDFSAPEATLSLIDVAVNAKKPVVIGTTGLGEAQISVIKKASEKIPVIVSPNMAVGVNLLFKLTEIAAKTLKERYDIEIFEAHHRHKKDAPSGTAKRLLEIVKSSASELQDFRSVEGRSGIIGERSKDEIGMMVLRGGDIVGEHTVFFVGEGERLELTHRATSRNNFATGAVLAIEFLLHQPPGMYSMFDVLGF